MGSSLRQRLLSAAILLPAVAALIWLGPWTLAFLLVLVALAGGWEMATLLQKSGWSAPRFLPGAAVAFLAASLSGWLDPVLLPLVLLACGLPLIWLFQRGLPRSTTDGLSAWGVHLLGALCLGVLLSFLARLQGGLRDASLLSGHEGARRVFCALLVAFSNDTGAYAVGSRWGRRKLWVAVSPRKTWEGAAGGLLVSTLAAAFLGPWLVPGLGRLEGALLGALVGVVAPLGDLVESRLKRQAGVKDSGSLIPGHGGMLDRLDSLLFVAPLFYYGLRGLAP